MIFAVCTGVSVLVWLLLSLLTLFALHARPLASFFVTLFFIYIFFWSLSYIRTGVCLMVQIGAALSWNAIDLEDDDVGIDK